VEFPVFGTAIFRSGVPGFDSRWVLGIFLFTTASRPSLEPTQPPIRCVPGTISLEIKRPGREADQSPPSSAEVKECVELHLHCSNTPSWRCDQLKIKYRNSFTFTFTFKMCISNKHTYSCLLQNIFNSAPLWTFVSCCWDTGTARTKSSTCLTTKLHYKDWQPRQLSQYSSWAPGWTIVVRLPEGTGIFSLRHRVPTGPWTHSASC
jgi:hypothetical protein